MDYKIASPDELAEVAKAVLKAAGDRRIFTLQGDLGAGKTTLVKAFCAQLGAGDVVKSPTFALVNTYSPDDGWNKARRDEISRRLVVVGSKPNELEQAFVDQVAEWEKACKHFGIGADKPAGAGDQPAAEGAEGNGGKSSKRRK